MFNNKRIFLAGVFCISILLLFLGWTVKGTYIGSDTKHYLIAGEQVISWLTTNEPELHELTDHKYLPYYTIPSVILSTVHTSLNLGEAGVMAVNWTLFSVAVCLLFCTWHKLYGFQTRSQGIPSLIVGATGGMYIIYGLPDGFLWSYAVLTDTIFLFWISVFVVSVTMGLLEGRRDWWTVSFIVAVSAPFVRPPGLLLPFLWLYALSLHLFFENRKNLKIFTLISLMIPAGMAFVVVPCLVRMKLNGEPLVDALVPDFLSTYFLWTVYFFKSGIVVPNRVELAVDSLPEYVDLLRMVLHRLTYYWFPLRFGDRPYSVIHNVVNMIYMVATLPLMALGIRELIRKSQRSALACLFLVAVAWSYALFHATTIVSFDWRYQLPGMVPYWILAGCGWHAILFRRSSADAARHGSRAL